MKIKLVVLSISMLLVSSFVVLAAPVTTEPSPGEITLTSNSYSTGSYNNWSNSEAHVREDGWLISSGSWGAQTYDSAGWYSANRNPEWTYVRSTFESSIKEYAGTGQWEYGSSSDGSYYSWWLSDTTVRKFNSGGWVSTDPTADGGWAGTGDGWWVEVISSSHAFGWAGMDVATGFNWWGDSRSLTEEVRMGNSPWMSSWSPEGDRPHYGGDAPEPGTWVLGTLGVALMGLSRLCRRLN